LSNGIFEKIDFRLLPRGFGQIFEDFSFQDSTTAAQFFSCDASMVSQKKARGTFLAFVKRPQGDVHVRSPHTLATQSKRTLPGACKKQGGQLGPIDFSTGVSKIFRSRFFGAK
jgi:hypothetical protein